MTSPAAIEPNLRATGLGGVNDRLARHPLLAGLCSGLLLWTSFPPVEWSWLAWASLVPLFWLVTQEGPRLRLYLAAWLGGLAFWTLSVQWVRLTDPTAWLAWLAMAGIFSLWWPGFLALGRLACFRLRLPLMVAAPILWVGMEYSRAHFMTGFPWYYLGHSQYRFLSLIQIADTTSALGVSFLIALVNAWIVDVLTLPLLRRTPRGARLTPRQTVRLWSVTLLLGGTLIYGAYRLSTANFRAGPRLALLQTNFEQRYKQGADPLEILHTVERMLERVAAAVPRPDLVVWPETAYPFGFITIDPATGPSELAEQLRRIGPNIALADWTDKKEKVDENLHLLTDALGIPMLVGSLHYDHRPGAIGKYNAALLFEPSVKGFQSYNKIHLVPFGEYIPFVDLMPWVKVFTPYRDGYVPSLTFGREPTVLPLGPYRMAVGICFEDTVPHIIRRFFRETPEGAKQPNLLVNISNDGWFHGSEELDMHLAVSVFRTIEHRVPLARAVNTGISALIDGNGEIRDTLPRQTEGVLTVSVPLDDRTSNYTVLGDWLGLSCLAVTIGLLPLGLLRPPSSTRRRPATRADKTSSPA
jgi:apolipoprotein N-acyltransferase